MYRLTGRTGRLFLSLWTVRAKQEPHAQDEGHYKVERGSAIHQSDVVCKKTAYSSPCKEGKEERQRDNEMTGASEYPCDSQYYATYFSTHEIPSFHVPGQTERTGRGCRQCKVCWVSIL